MAIFLDENSKVIVQGMTGSEGMKHTQRMLRSGTAIVGGVNPRKAGTTVEFEGGVSVPVFGTVAEAMETTGADVSVIFVPAAFTKAAATESSEKVSQAASSLIVLHKFPRVVILLYHFLYFAFVYAKPFGQVLLCCCCCRFLRKAHKIKIALIG